MKLPPKKICAPLGDFSEMELGPIQLITGNERIDRYIHDILVENKKLRESAPRWISVEERLPEPLTKVLTIRRLSDWQAIDFIIDGTWQSRPSSEVTHWMPLPIFLGGCAFITYDILGRIK